MTKKTSKQKSGELLSAKEAAERLNLTEQQTRTLIRDGKLPATRIGRTWIIDSNDLALAQNRPKVGRPATKKPITTKKATSTTPATEDDKDDN